MKKWNAVKNKKVTHFGGRAPRRYLKERPNAKSLRESERDGDRAAAGRGRRLRTGGFTVTDVAINYYHLQQQPTNVFAHVLVLHHSPARRGSGVRRTPRGDLEFEGHRIPSAQQPVESNGQTGDRRRLLQHC
ncbi:unnamed protein product [Heligmosomoides polygyrus]|uniref:Uncharacterized protein n=1 Tax=Heligmosomoides polygyrus TaxID=6339 RepID=A0A183GB07_HELPZ|nr:unnamed protein product [Heligmosomoides polygyrus]